MFSVEAAWQVPETTTTWSPEQFQFDVSRSTSSGTLPEQAGFKLQLPGGPTEASLGLDDLALDAEVLGSRTCSLCFMSLVVISEVHLLDLVYK